MLIKRRTFLQTGSLATASLLVPKFMKAFEPQQLLVPPGNKTLVVIQFSGGNDGLNTVVPITNDWYYRGRPTLNISAEKAHTLTTDAGLHPALTICKELYDQGELAIMNSVGYPNPDRSHFRSMDIWHSASESNEYFTTGWLGRYLDEQCKNCTTPTQALEVDDVLSLVLKGEQNKGLALRDPKGLYGVSSGRYFNSLHHAHEHEEETVDYLYKTMSETISSAEYIYRQSQMHPSAAQYPSTKTGKSLKTIASLILSDINTRVYYVSLGSFDTHVNQANQQTKLFTELNDALTVFVKDLKQNRRFEDVMIMTFSEFGRRVKQNASNGTDHGTANNMFFISGGLRKKGILNPLPDLQDLIAGDLKHQVDFKTVYATILRKWLNADDRAILGKEYTLHDFI
jgi:uncharacterized protein (DUF1501 family)